MAQTIDDIEIRMVPYSINDPLIRQFQIAVFADHGLKFSKLSDIDSHQKWTAITGPIANGRDLNDAYRWLPYRLGDKLDTCLALVGGKPVSMSFTELYGEFVRIGVNNYTLRSYRTTVRDPGWGREHGYFGMILKGYPALGHFVTYNESNRKLAALIKMLRKKRGSSGQLGTPGTYISEFTIEDPQVMFHGIMQHIAYRNNHVEDQRPKLMAMLTDLGSTAYEQGP